MLILLINKTAYDVFQYIDITQSHGLLRMIDEKKIQLQLDFYDPSLMPQASPIEIHKNICVIINSIWVLIIQQMIIEINK